MGPPPRSYQPLMEPCEGSQQPRRRPFGSLDDELDHHDEDDDDDDGDYDDHDHIDDGETDNSDSIWELLASIKSSMLSFSSRLF